MTSKNSVSAGIHYILVKKFVRTELLDKMLKSPQKVLAIQFLHSKR